MLCRTSTRTWKNGVPDDPDTVSKNVTEDNAHPGHR